MTVELMKCKIHRATVTDANLNYEGSITIDSALMEAAGLFPFEKVSILDVTNGARFDTYVIEGNRDSGVICLNGAAARLVQKGDLVIIVAYVAMTPEEAKTWNPTVVKVDSQNKILE
ncbi:MAG: aspartate 1-decarboxylase [Fibrobacteraceae bacterium]|nr:aspartate 1-decarboxylase [Fibrobacteraceae bacterium]